MKSFINKEFLIIITFVAMVGFVAYMCNGVTLPIK